jgi:putative glycosyltransferase
MQLSVVTTLYQSSPYIKEFYRRVKNQAEKITQNYEIIFVNDGSPDNSLEIVSELFEEDKRIRIINLSKNFGHHRAIMTGLNYARGELVFLIDSDLEEEPEFLESFYQEMARADADVVYGVQKSRKGGLFERVTGKLFYMLFNMLSNYPIPEDLLTAKLMKKKYVSRLVKFQDPDFFLAGFWEISGFRQVPVVVKKHDKGETSYSFKRKFLMTVDAITSFSGKPLAFIFYLGILISSFSMLAALYVVFRSIFFGDLLMGWPSLIVSIWLLGGTTIFCLGIIGIYLSKIFMETKRRPFAVVKEIYENPRGMNNEFGQHSEKIADSF